MGKGNNREESLTEIWRAYRNLIIQLINSRLKIVDFRPLWSFLLSTHLTSSTIVLWLFLLDNTSSWYHVSSHCQVRW